MTQKFYSKFTEPKKSNKKTAKQSKTDFKKFENVSVEKSKNYQKFIPNAKILENSSLFCENKLEKAAVSLIENFDNLVQEIRPLNSRQIQQLPENIRNLSHQMTDDRSSRRLGYMNENVQLSAYVRYFVWWNLIRLCRLFTNLPAKAFPNGNEEIICLDLGSGPMTVVTALWIARPELRNLNFTWYCVDVSQNSLTFGQDIYMSVAAKLPPWDVNANPHWKIIRIKDSFGTPIKQKADFITCANMFNELDQASSMPPEYQTKKYFEQLLTYSKSSSKFLLIEPGVPKAARILSLFRERFNKQNFLVFAPCTHIAPCPMNGFKAFTGSSNKWCNFAFSTANAPLKLLKLSTQAKLPKDRAVLSFICAYPNTTSQELQESFSIRITSDPFILPDKSTGFYACSTLGLTLIKTQNPERFHCGDKLVLEIKTPDSLPVDKKSGAKIIFL